MTLNKSIPSRNILIVCDPPVGAPGTNVGGVHAVQAQMRKYLIQQGHKVEIVSGEVLMQVPEGQTAYEYVSSLFSKEPYDNIHIVTQTRLGLLALRYCRENGLNFTTTYDTLIPEYMEARHNTAEVDGLNLHEFMDKFLGAAARVITPTQSMADRLKARGLDNVVVCMHGVDTDLFKPVDRDKLEVKRPLYLYVGRVTPEKGVEDFLRLDVDGTKVVVGGASGGLNLDVLKKQYPDVHFLGVKTGAELAYAYGVADVFVFPSRTDTFGLVNWEALATGTPVAAYPVTGPKDVIPDDETVGILDEDLAKACRKALTLSREACREFALRHTWADSAKRFASNLVPAKASLVDGLRGVSPFGKDFDEVEQIIGKTATILFADEPAGPYSRGAKP